MNETLIYNRDQNLHTFIYPPLSEGNKQSTAAFGIASRYVAVKQGLWPDK